jgi:archaellum component FlaG (FlaF/FlaG flagellin family)
MAYRRLQQRLEEVRMKNRRWAAPLAVACVTGILVGLAALRASSVITLSSLPQSDYPGPVGIDWISTSNRLLISTYYDTGLPHNFETVDRGTGAHVQWGTQSGWQNEIYFATVRPGQPGGWVEGDVFSAKGFVDLTHIAQFDANGTQINATFATLPGEAKLKRGGMTFDRYGVPGLNGALLVLASNPTSLEGGGYTVWKVDVSGIAQKVIDLPDGGHGEGIAVIPNDPAYGPWAGKILVGKEETNEIDEIDPVTKTRVVRNVGVAIEDIWVIPPNADFYGVDYPNGRIWTTPASDWASAGLVGKVLFAQEHPALLFVASWNGSSFDIADISVAGPESWEHITFVPAATPGLTIVKSTNGADANDPNAAGVPNIAPGGVVTWTYVVTNTGQTSVPRAQVSVTDNTTGVTPTFASETSGNGDTIFDPGEVWLYTATGTAIDLTLAPPAGVHTIANSCTAGGTQPPRTAYTNVGTASIPGASATDPSSYCNPPATPRVTIVKYTNGQDANDPNGGDVPNVPQGGTVTWTYKVTNTGTTSVPKAQVSVTDNTTGVTPVFSSVLTGNADAILDPGEVWLYTATGAALDLTAPPPAGVHTAANVCTAGGTQPPRTAYTNLGTVTIPGASASDPSSYCNPPPLPCPAGSFAYSFDASGNLNIIYDQFPAPNDNSYGVNAVGWGTHGHKFSDLTGSDHAGFQLVDGNGVVKLDFKIDYLSAKTGTASGYASLGATGGDGGINVAADGQGATGITGDSSLARNLNNLGYFVGGSQVPATKTATNGTDLLLNSPATVNTTDNYTLLTPNPWVNGWNFHDTYFVTISAARQPRLQRVVESAAERRRTPQLTGEGMPRFDWRGIVQPHGDGEQSGQEGSPNHDNERRVDGRHSDGPRSDMADGQRQADADQV